MIPIFLRKSGLNIFDNFHNDQNERKRDVVVVDYYAIMFFCDFLNCLIIIFTYQYFGVSLNLNLNLTEHVLMWDSFFLKFFK